MGTDSTYTYTASANCYVVTMWSINYAGSGYRRLTKNGTIILNNTTKGTFSDLVKLNSGDVLVADRDSSIQKLFYAVLPA